MIKYIHCFGTSFSAGGGFEFDSVQTFKPKLKKLYSNCGETLTQENFSWPGQLQKLINNHKIKVKNYSKSGFGNQAMYRIAYDIISNPDFRIEENLFIFEFSYVGRREYFLKSVGDYVILNYNDINQIDNGGHFEMGYDYFYDSKDIQKKLTDFKKILLKLFKYTKTQENVEKEIEQNNSFFYNFLKNIGIHFLFSQPPTPTYLFDDIKNNILFKDFNNYVIKIEDDNNVYNGIADLVHHSKYFYSLSNETNGIINDIHLGLKGNKLIAVNVYNNLIKNKYISDNLIDIRTVLNEKINVCNLI